MCLACRGQCSCQCLTEGAFATWRGDRGGRVRNQMGKKVIWTPAWVEMAHWERRGWACSELWQPFANWLGTRAHAGCWKQGKGREFSFALRTNLSNNTCSLYLLQVVVQQGPNLANWILLTTCLSLWLLRAYWEEFADLHNSHPHRLQVKQYMVQAQPWIQFLAAWFKSYEIL